MSHATDKEGIVGQKGKDVSSKHILFMGDGHGGHRAGLTPPKWQWRIIPREHERNFYVRLQKELWDAYRAILRRFPRPDYVFYNGDAIDGRGEKSGCLELITLDRKEQVAIAKAVIEQANPRLGTVMTEGTPYHVGKEEKWEQLLAREVGGTLRKHAWPRVNGLVFDMKHHIRGGSMPHTRPAPISKAKLQNILWARHKRQPDSDIIIRSHVHYYCFTGEYDWLGMTLPGLQAAATGLSAICEGEVHFGLVHMEVFSNGSYRWTPRIVRLGMERVRVIRLS